MNTMRRFLLVGMQRSGTTVTRAQLESHPQVAMFRDELHTAFFATAIGTRSRTGETREDRTTSLLEVWDHLVGPRPDVVAGGIKTALPSAAYAARLVGCLQEHGPGIDLIVVHRRDLVAQLGSLKRAQAAGVWHRRANAAAADIDRRVRITDAELAGYVRECIDSHRLLAQLADGRRTLHLDYDDDIVAGRDWPRLCEFLAIEPLPRPEGSFRKFSPPAIDYIDDYLAHSAALPALVEAVRRTPAPAPVFDTEESRLFLLYRAHRAIAKGRPDAAVPDVLAALDAPADWGTEARDWACDLLAEALERAGDAVLAETVAARLAASWPDDAHVVALVGRIRRALGH